MSGPLQWTPDGMVAAITGSNDVAGATVHAPPPKRAADEGEEDDDDDDIYGAPPSAAPRPSGTQPRKAQPLGPPPNVVKLARERLREVEKELRVRRKLEAERDELKRLIAAATNKPRAAVVRELPKRTSAG